jgi:xanthine dehydrogenase YagS FAD-binding subunit
MNDFEHTSAASAADALAKLGGAPSAPGTSYPAAPARFIAGGTDLIPLMHDHLAAPIRLIDLKPAHDLRGVRLAADGALAIGALTTLTDIERDPAVAERAPILIEAVREAATPQLRAMATIGGNLLQRTRCWYFRGETRCWLKGGDTCYARAGRSDHHAILGTDSSPCIAVHPSDLAPALVALDARVAISGPRGTHAVPVADLLQPPTADRRVEHTLAPDELITAIEIPPQPAGARGVYLKAMERAAWSFALASAAVQLALRDGRVDHIRIVLGGVAPTPWRAVDAERLLIGQPLTPALATQAAERALASASPFDHNAYKLPLARALVRRAVLGASAMESEGA